VLTDEDGFDTRALLARWQLADGETLAIALNLAKKKVPFDAPTSAPPIFETPRGAHYIANEGYLPPQSCITWLGRDEGAGTPRQ